LTQVAKSRASRLTLRFTLELSRDKSTSPLAAHRIVLKLPQDTSGMNQPSILKLQHNRRTLDVPKVYYSKCATKNHITITDNGTPNNQAIP
jgi:hypothetical protein